MGGYFGGNLAQKEKMAQKIRIYLWLRGEFYLTGLATFESKV